MLNDADASGFKKVYLAMGFTDLRRGIDGLATILGSDPMKCSYLQETGSRERQQTS